MQTTMEEIRSLVAILEKLIEPLFEGEVVEDTYESNKRPHLVLQEGSKTYGRAFRIFFSGGSHYGSGHWEPRGFSDYLGGTKTNSVPLGSCVCVTPCPPSVLSIVLCLCPRLVCGGFVLLLP